MILNITAENFEKETTGSGKKVLLDFWAVWCGPCRMIAPAVEAIAEENPQIVVGKVNVDEQAELAVKFGIVSIPTLVVLEEGKAVRKAVGVQSKQELQALIDG